MISVREALDLVGRDLAPLGSEQVPLPHAPAAASWLRRWARRAISRPFATRPWMATPCGRLDTATAGAGAAAAFAHPRSRRRWCPAVSDGHAGHGDQDHDRFADARGRRRGGAHRGHGRARRRRRCARHGCPGASVRHPGEDMRAGEIVLMPGRALRPADIGLLASLGVAVVGVRRRPVVAILSTGDELVELGQPLAPGQIVNSNAYTLAAAVEEAGGTPRLLGIVRDTVEATRGAFLDAFNSDVVLSTGGVSMGTFDLVRATLAELGVVERFWKVAQKPGKPLAFGIRAGVPVFGLPGNPVSSLVCFYLYVRPALRAMQGLERLHLPTVDATLDETVHTAAGLTEFVRCIVEGEPTAYRARATGSQSSGVLRSLSLGQGLIIAPPEVTTIERGSRVRVML